MRKEGVPRKVLEAMHDANHAALSAMGRKGAEAREEKKEAAMRELIRRDAEIFNRDLQNGVAINDEGDVVPPDDLLH